MSINQYIKTPWREFGVAGKDALLHESRNEYTPSKFGETQSKYGAPHYLAYQASHSCIKIEAVPLGLHL